ncbi:SAM-dependent methyltransferase [Frankia sp. CcI49]|uniref:SAM-dependent methyltransferase n=1 Tax=unclassified Frankia TaxID=2632575 RepID=UPI0006CA585C|nr:MULTISPECIES: SAM-dependent methyltransferase [unclassified Frankia]KPM53955.1 SAM-dependent methyltransferase [Frankia sp. R43]ONH61906.1 SAM-dependent methyltransferase [Frankia sp. CcI49]
MSQDKPAQSPLVRAIHEPPAGWSPEGIDTSVPSIARVYDAILGGKDNFPVDRAVADELMRLAPRGRQSALYNRALLGRGVRFMASQGIRQFVDLGSGLPTAQNTHETAQAVAPDARVVYIDNDPIVLSHGRALLAENENTTVLTADFRSPEQVLNHPELTGIIDFDQPVALLLFAVVHHIEDAEDPAGILATYREHLAPGSYLFLTHFVTHGEETAELEKVMLADLGRGRFRTIAEITAFFDGFELLEPGVTYTPLWRPEEPLPDPLTLTERLVAGGLARRP